MKIAVLGLGSMGKRRVRCLQTLGITEIIGVDIRQDRCREAQKKFKIIVENDIKAAIQNFRPDIAIISLPPREHTNAMQICLKKNIHFFVEASVVDDGIVDVIKQLKNKKIVAAPSATLMFHPAIKIISSVVSSGTLGKLSNITLHSGQYLPDWHKFELVSDYYVSERETGGAREIVPFEITWLTKIFGFPKSVIGRFTKTIDIPGAETIDDTYTAILDYNSFLINLTVDVVSRSSVRRLLINGSLGQLIWDWNHSFVNIYISDENSWQKLEYNSGQAEIGYNKNIGEIMYVNETETFLNAVKLKQKFPNTLEEDLKVLSVLYSIEKSSQKQKVVRI